MADPAIERTCSSVTEAMAWASEGIKAMLNLGVISREGLRHTVMRRTVSPPALKIALHYLRAPLS
eukprot:7620245-Alexandrium_andersonii.AAC.2